MRPNDHTRGRTQETHHETLRVATALRPGCGGDGGCGWRRQGDLDVGAEAEPAAVVGGCVCGRERHLAAVGRAHQQLKHLAQGGQRAVVLGGGGEGGDR